jgi:hypothetical protein
MPMELGTDMAREDGGAVQSGPRGLPGRVYRGIHRRRRSHTWGAAPRFAPTTGAVRRTPGRLTLRDSDKPAKLRRPRRPNPLGDTPDSANDRAGQQWTHPHPPDEVDSGLIGPRREHPTPTRKPSGAVGPLDPHETAPVSYDGAHTLLRDVPVDWAGLTKPLQLRLAATRQSGRPRGERGDDYAARTCPRSGTVNLKRWWLQRDDYAALTRPRKGTVNLKRWCPRRDSNPCFQIENLGS